MDREKDYLIREDLRESNNEETSIISQDDSEVIGSRSQRYHHQVEVTPNQKASRWRQWIGALMVLLALLMLGGNYYFTSSKSAVLNNFYQGIEKTDYQKIASVAHSDLATNAWSSEDAEMAIKHYEAMGINWQELIDAGVRPEKLTQGGREIARLKRVGDFFFILPVYRMVFHSLPLEIHSTNDFRDIQLQVVGQADQAMSKNQGLFVDPRASQLTVLFNRAGQKEEVAFDLDYAKVQEGRHQINLQSVKNRLKLDKTAMGLRPSLDFKVLSFEIDGQAYQQSDIELSGYQGQVFQVKFVGEYNGQRIESQVVDVPLIQGTEVVPDYSKDFQLKDQIIKAELR